MKGLYFQYLAVFLLLGLHGLGQAAEPAPGAGASGQKPVLMIDSGGHTAQVTSLLFTHDGRYLVSGGDDKVIRVWNVETGETVRTLRGQIQPGDEGKIYAAALSPDDRYLAVGGWLSSYGDIRLYDFQTGEMVAVFHGHENVIIALDFSPDGRMLASASADKTVRLWEVASRKPLHVLSGHKDFVYTVAFSPAGDRVVSGSGDRSLRLWDAKSGELLRDMEGHEGRVKTAAFSPDGRYIASGSEDKSIRLWDATTGSFVKELSRGEYPVYGLAFTPDGQRLLVRNVPSFACTVLSIPAGEVLFRFEKHDNTVNALAVSPDGKIIATGGGNANEIYLWDPTAGSVIRKLVGHGRPVWSVGFARDGRSIAFGTTLQAGELNDRGPLEQTLVLGHSGELGVSLEGRSANTGTFQRATERLGTYQLKTKSGNIDPVLQVLRDGKVIREIERDSYSGYDHRSFTWINAGNQFVSGGSRGFLSLYDSNTGEKIRDLVGHTGDIWAIAPSPDGKRLVSGSDDQTIRLWDLTTGTNLLTVFVATDEWVAWTPRGYYTSSLHGDRYLGWHVNQGVDRAAAYYPAAQFQQLYRPDVVAEYLKDGDIEKALARANVRRGPSTAPASAVASIDAILPPLVYVVEPGRDGVVVEKETLHVKAAALSNNLPITDLQVTVNGLQVAGLPEGNAKGEPLQREVEVEVTLSPGDNVLTFQAAHAKARSQALARHVTYQPSVGTHPATPAKPNLILLAIGISDYSDPPLRLSWAAEDARQIYERFKRQEGKIFGHVEAKLLPEGKTRASRSEILSALDWFEGQGTTGDVRVLFLSGHGTLDRHRNFYFLSQDQTATGDPELDGIRWSRFLDSLTNGPVHPVLLVDACHAAAAAKGPARARVDLTEVVKTLNSVYPNLVTFTASSGSELSVELDKWRHGAFTQALLEGLAGKADGLGGGRKDGQIDTLELSTWLARRVGELTGDQQHATFDSGGVPPFPLFQVEP
jgi:WD40 repeat protein